MRRPKFKPTPPWKYRVILCNEAGNQVNDDVYLKEQILYIVSELIEELHQKYPKKEKEDGREKQAAPRAEAGGSTASGD
jgi:hypothetical protein